MNPRILLVVLAAALALFITLIAGSGVRSSGSGDVVAPVVASTPELEQGSPQLEAQSPISSPAAASGVVRAPLAAAVPIRCTTGRIVGRVASKADHMVITRGTVVALRVGSEPPGTSGVSAYVPLDADGRYELAGLETGNWTVTCTAPGFETAERPAWTPEENGERVIDFLLVPHAPAQVISVHLRSTDGRSLRAVEEIDPEALLRVLCLESCPARDAVLPSGARVLPSHAIALQPADDARRNVPPDEDDAWFRVKLSHQLSGCCCVLAGDKVLDVVPFGPQTTRIDMMVRPDDMPYSIGSVRLRVLDEDTKRPLTNACAWLRTPDGRIHLDSTSSLDGIVLTGLPVGKATVLVGEFDHEGAEFAVEIRRGKVTRLGDVFLRRK